MDLENAKNVICLQHLQKIYDTVRRESLSETHAACQYIATGTKQGSVGQHWETWSVEMLVSVWFTKMKTPALAVFFSPLIFHDFYITQQTIMGI